jgi:hypothetical protein
MKVQIGDKTWDKDALHALLDRNDEAVGRALMVVYGNQTADERAAFATKHHNGVGFTGADAEWLTDIAKKWQTWRRWASARQCNAVRKSIKKYHRQILEHMLENTPGAVLVAAREKPAPVVPMPPVSTTPVYGMF